MNDERRGSKEMAAARTVFVVSLGCPKNLVDTEVLLGALRRRGYRLVQRAEEAGVLLVNTCGFLREAAEEAIDEILALAELKEADPEKRLVVCGCLVQRYQEELAESLPEVDLFFGTEDQPRLAELLDTHLAQAGAAPRLRLPRRRSLMQASWPRLLTTPPHRAYLKVSEGCSNRCTYCVIPSIRGPLRSRPIQDLAQEAQLLAQQGVQELTLVGQDLTAYGRDLADGANLASLLRRLLVSCDIPWIRVLYLYPDGLDEPLLDLFADNASRLLPYFDVPMQHASDRVLRRMGRPYRLPDLDRLVDAIRVRFPDSAIRTSLITGFPGETDQDFQILEQALERWRLDHVGVFAYSDEEGAPAAAMRPKVPPEVAEERRRRLLELQAQISAQRLARFQDRTLKVLLEGYSRETDLLLEGRAFFQAAEIDGCVYINKGTAETGAFVTVRITETHTYDLVGEICPTDVAQETVRD